jgi:hypothetical protein
VDLAAALSELHDAGIDLARSLDAAADRHSLDADMGLHCRTLAKRARHHAGLIAQHADRLGAGPLAERPPGALASALSALREGAGAVLGHDPHAGELLLHDLRHLHRLAAEVEVGWWIVRQGALVHRDQGLHELFERCHEEAWNQLRWLKTKIKETAPQVLSAPPAV